MKDTRTKTKSRGTERRGTKIKRRRNTNGESKITRNGMQARSNVSVGTRGPAALVFTVAIFLLFFNVIAKTSNNSQVKCSKTCVAENCNSINIRYGKYCGVGWSGCPGEKPCDDLDACCKIHDECVENKGAFSLIRDHPWGINLRSIALLFNWRPREDSAFAYIGEMALGIYYDFTRSLTSHGCYPWLTDVKCHEKFKKCIKKVQKSGKVGFSRDCPYDITVPTMVQGMDLAIMFSQFGNSKFEL